jgi:hypothetical protein
MAKYLIDLDLLIYLLTSDSKVINEIKSVNKSVEFYVVSLSSNKVKIASLKKELFDKCFILSKQLPLSSQFKQEDDSYSYGKILIHIIQVNENKVDEAKHLLPDVKDVESAVELLYAADLELDVVITEDSRLFKYQESDLNESISWSVMIEDLRYLKKMVTHQDDVLPEEQIKIVYNLVQDFGQEDWGNWYVNYDELESNLDTIQQVLDMYLQWGDYNRLKNTWQSLNRFCDLYNHHDLRLKWLSKLIPLAFKEKDWNYYVSANTSKAWTHIMLGELSSAGQILECARNYLTSVTETELISFYYCLCTYHIHSLDNEYDKYSIIAKDHFQEAEFCIEKRQQIIHVIVGHYSSTASVNNLTANRKLKTTVDPRRLQRYQINVLRNIAKLHYISGELDIALKSYETVRYQSQEINHLRSLCYAHNKLADIYLDFAENSANTDEKKENIHKAEEHLLAGKSIALRNKNHRRIAAYLTSESRLFKIKGEEKEASNKDWAAGEYRIGYQVKKHNKNINS